MAVVQVGGGALEEAPLVVAAGTPVSQNFVTPVKNAPSACGITSFADLELSPLAKRIPAARKCADPAEQRTRELTRKSLVRCVDFLVKHEHLATTIWGMIEADMLADMSSVGQDAAFFKEAPKNLRMVDRSLKAKWLMDHSEQALDMDCLRKLDTADEQLVHDLVCVFTKLTGSETLPKQAKEKAFLSEMLCLRMASTGCESIKQWAARAVTRASGTLDMKVGGAYQLTFTAGFATSVRHRSNITAEIPAYVRIQPDWTVEHPLSDVAACVKKGAAIIVLASLFPAGSAPHLAIMDKKGQSMKALTLQAESSLAAKKKAAGADAAEDTTPLVDHVKKRRSAALERARANLAANPKRQRTFSFGEVAEGGGE